MQLKNILAECTYSLFLSTDMLSNLALSTCWDKKDLILHSESKRLFLI